MEMMLSGLDLSTWRSVSRPFRIWLCMRLARIPVVLNRLGTWEVTTLSTGRQLLVTILS